MTVYYEEMMELWKAGKFFEAISYFSQWMSKGFYTQEEIENLSKNLATFWKLIELQCKENVEVMFSLYEMLRKARNWDDGTLCKRLRISQKAIEDIKNNRRPRSKIAVTRMLYELFPQMAV